MSLPQDSDKAIPSKIFEHMLFDAWILALADRVSATEVLLRGSVADVVVLRDVDGITAVLATLYREYAAGCRPTRLAACGRFGRQHQARILFDAFERCLGKSHTHTRVHHQGALNARVAAE